MKAALESYQPMIALKTYDEDTELVENSISGDEIAFSTLVNKYRRYVYSIAYRFVHNHDEADDLTQETFIRVYSHLKSFRHESSLKTWLGRIVSNLAINVKKSSRICMDSGLDPEDLQNSVSAHGLNPLIKMERTNKLNQAIAKLPPRQKQTLLLRSFKEMSCQDVAKIMKCSEGTVKANLFNAIKNLKTLMGDAQ